MYNYKCRSVLQLQYVHASYGGVVKIEESRKKETDKRGQWEVYQKEGQKHLLECCYFRCSYDVILRDGSHLDDCSFYTYSCLVRTVC